MRANPLLCLVAILSVLATSAVAAPDPFRDFSDKYRCPIADRLQRLFDAGDPAQDRDRYLVVEMPDDRYVQCRFREGETRLACEAWSGFYDAAPGTPRTAHLAPTKVAALAHLGFSTDDSAGNFRCETAVSNPPDFGATADLILHTLYDAFDMRAEAALRFDAPFAPGLTLACDPVG